MKKMQYESPELDIRWFESDSICLVYVTAADGDHIGGDEVFDDEW